MANTINVNVTGLGGFDPAGVPTPGRNQGAIQSIAFPGGGRGAVVPTPPPVPRPTPPNLAPMPPPLPVVPMPTPGQPAQLPYWPGLMPPVQTGAGAAVGSSAAGGAAGGAAGAATNALPPLGGLGAIPGAASVAAAAAMGPLGVAILAVKSAAESLATGIRNATSAMDIYTQRTLANAQTLALRTQNKELSAQVSNTEKNYDTIAKGFGMISNLTPPILKMLGLDPGAWGKEIVGAAKGMDTAGKKKFLADKESYENRFGEIARYDSRLAQIQGRGEFRKISRDIQESHILGDRLGTLAKQQQELDTVQQQIDIAKKHADLAQQNNDTHSRIKDLNKELNETLKKVPKETAEAIRRLGQQVDTPLTELIKRAPQIPGQPVKAPPDNAAKNRLNAPILQGAVF